MTEEVDMTSTKITSVVIKIRLMEIMKMVWRFSYEAEAEEAEEEL
jgi:hypothetical protein